MKSNVSVRDFLATKKIVNLVHQNKLFISVWTIDKKSQGLKYQRRGVDFITTNNIKLFD
jgi:glycerophosphoryl diester phosphodiesterase